MLKVDKIEVMNFHNAIRGARNPMNSWAKSDSSFDENGNFVLGENDLSLAVRLRKAGSDHRKFLRQIFVTADITAPMYWWKEYDTYKVSTVANSCSTMHKIHAKEFTLDDFSTDHLTSVSTVYLNMTINQLNVARDYFISTKDKSAWWQMIQLLPSSYNQKRTLDFNYETAVQIIRQRTGHKLDEWHVFVDALWDLPYMREIVEGMKTNDET